VAFESVLPGDFTGSSDAKAFFSAGIGFHFWHVRVYMFIKIYSLFKAKGRILFYNL